MTDPRASPVPESPGAAILRVMVSVLVDRPAPIAAVETEGRTVFTVHPDHCDIGKLIGNQGRTAKAIRTLLNAIGAAEGRDYQLVIADSPRKRE